MFESMTEQESRESILESVKAYCEKFHMQDRQWKKGQRIPYAARVYDSREMTALVDSALDFWLTAGRYTQLFEKELYCNIQKYRCRAILYDRRNRCRKSCSCGNHFISSFYLPVF